MKKKLKVFGLVFFTLTAIAFGINFNNYSGGDLVFSIVCFLVCLSAIALILRPSIKKVIYFFSQHKEAKRLVNSINENRQRIESATPNLALYNESELLMKLEVPAILGYTEALLLETIQDEGFYRGKTPAENYKNYFDGVKNILNQLKSKLAEEKLLSEDYDLMDGHQFEQYCAALLRNNGYQHVEVTSGSGDFGVDITAERDGISFAIQCKRYDKPVGNDAVQEAYTGRDFYKKTAAAVLTNQSFTKSATETAKALGVALWDRNHLEKLIEGASANTVQAG